MRWPLLLLAGGSLAVPIFVGYAYSADILKFSAVALFAMGILAGAALTNLAGRDGTRSRIAFWASLTATVMSGVVAIGGILWAQFRHVETLSTYYEGPLALGKDDRQAVAWLRTHVLPDDIIYRAPDVVLGYALSGGLSTTELETNTRLFGVPEALAADKKALLEKLPADLGSYRTAGIDWFVVGPDDPRMESNVGRWASAGELIKKAEFGKLAIYRVANTGSSPTPPPGP